MSKNTRLHKFVPIRNTSGSVILSALALAVVVTIMILSSTNYIRSRSTQVFASSDKLATRIVVDGLLSYTVNAIKQSWCFSSTWAQDNTCGLTHAKYAARLMLTDETISYIQTSGMTLPSGDLRLTEISQTVTLSQLPESHPLNQLTLPLKGIYPTVTFTIKRDDSAISTTKGKEVPLRIIIKAPAPTGSKVPDLEINSKVIVYPRELSYFALIVPNNLYLGATVPEGNRGHNSFANVNVSANKGLRFESPVFVNGDLFLPPSSLSTPMNNVTFVDKVVIGEGMIKQNGNFFVPKDGGGENSMFNYKIPSFSGLLGGFELDVERDMGLDYLFNIQPSADTFSDFELCKLRQMAAYDLKVTRDSQLFVKAISSGANTATVTASIGIVDNLIEQVDAGDHRKVVTTLSTSGEAGIYTSFASGAVFKAKMIYEGLRNPNTGVRGIYSHEFYLSRTGVVTLYPLGSNNPAGIKITTSPHYVSAKPQHNQVDIKVDFLNPSSLDLGPFDTGNVKSDGTVRLVLEAMDYAYNYSNNLREANSTHATMGKFKINGFTFSRSGSDFSLNAAALNVWYNNPMLTVDSNYLTYDSAQAPTTDRDFNSFDARCFGVPEGSEAYYTSFPSASWSTSFVTQSEHAWRFSADAGFDKGYFNGVYVFNSTNAGASPAWAIRSLIETCRIDSTATFVTGFYTCNNLVIAARTAPLRIVGTFIAKNVQIDNTAYSAGIRWSTIYHPQAVYELRKAQILGREKDGSTIDCEDASLPPLWASNLGIPSTLKHYNCNPVSLRTADPFKWTTVDPDCGIPPNSVEVKCKKAATRFLVKEISRSKGL